MKDRPKLPNLRISSVRKTFLVIIVTAVIFGLGYSVGYKGYLISLASEPKVHILREVPVKDLDFSLFWKVWDSLNTSYFDKSKLSPSKMVYGAIKGMVEAVGDPYTVFLAPSENKMTEDDLHGNFEGVGIQIGFKGTQLAVIAPLPGSPAEAAGVKAGDLIIGIKDEKKGIDTGTANMNLPDAVQAIRGTAGTEVTLALLREGSDKPIVTTIKRASIDVPSVSLSYEGKNKNIAHIKVTKFGSETLDEWNKAVAEIKTKTNTLGLIVDVRNNPGGYLQAAVDLASDFVDSGSVVVKEEYSNGQNDEIKSIRAPRLQDLKTVVLINKGSASASEILSGAMRDDRKIKLIGDISFGKGTVQEPQQLDNGAGLHVTIARWLTPSGYWVNEKGLEPDTKIKDNADTPEDEQLIEAISQIEK